MRRRILAGALGVCSLILAALAMREAYPFWKSAQELEKLRMQVIAQTSGDSDAQADESDADAYHQMDWETLKKQNSNIIAWLEIPGTQIDYPILHAQVWNEYLYRDFQNRYSAAGSVFVQPETAADFSDRHVILYGHNITGKRMFGALHDYEEAAFAKTHRELRVYLPGQILIAQVYSAYHCEDQSETYRTGFSDGQDFLAWVRMSVGKREYALAGDFSESDRVVTLSTCAGEGDRRRRYVIHAAVTAYKAEKSAE